MSDRLWLIVAGDLAMTGGMDRANWALASWLARQGERTHVVAHRIEPEVENIQSILAPRPGGRHLLGAPLLDWTGRQWAKRLGPNAQVIVNGGNCLAPEAINWVHYVHAAYRAEDRPFRRRIWDRRQLRAESLALRVKARRIIANSRRTRQDLIELLGVDPEKIRVCHYGIDADRFRPLSAQERGQSRQALGIGDDVPLAVFVGALGDDRKGFATLAEAWEKTCHNSGWDGALLVIGTGSTLESLRGRASTADWGRSVRFLGFRADVPQLVGACDLLISPTRYEAYGLNVHEAICQGVPAIVSADAGIAERFPAHLANDWLLPDPRNAEDLASRLIRWRDRVESAKMEFAPLGAQLRARSWDDCARELTEWSRT